MTKCTFCTAAVLASAACFATPVSREYVDLQISNTVVDVDKKISAAELEASTRANDLWAEDKSQAIDGFGDVYETSWQEAGCWVRSVITQPYNILQWYTNGVQTASGFQWKSDNGQAVTYSAEDGAVTVAGQQYGSILPGLDPLAGDDLGSVTNAQAGVSNIVKFIVRGYSKKYPAKTRLTLDDTLAAKTVTGLKHDGRQVFDVGQVSLPDYAKDYNAKFATLNSKLTVDDMYGWSAGYSSTSIVGRIHQLELGGTNITKYLNRTDIAEYDDDTLLESSIVGNVLDLSRNKYLLWSEDGMYSHNATGELFGVSIQDSKFTRSDGKVFKYYTYMRNTAWLNDRYAHLFCHNNSGSSYFIYYVPGDGEIGFCWQEAVTYRHTNVVWGTTQTGLDPRVAGTKLPNQHDVGFNTTTIIGYIGGISGTNDLTFTSKSQQRNTKPYDKFATTNEFSSALNGALSRYTTTAQLEASYYDKDEVNTIISNKVEQKRVLYLYDDEEDPWQFSDSAGRLYKYEYQPFGGVWTQIYTNTSSIVVTNVYAYTGVTKYNNKPRYTWQAGGAEIYMYSDGYMQWGSYGQVAMMPADSCPTNSFAASITNFTFDATSWFPAQGTWHFTYKMQEKVLVEEPYDQFVLKSESDAENKAIYDSMDTIYDNMDAKTPTLYMASTNYLHVNINPLFKTVGSFSIANTNSIIQLNTNNFIRIPVNTAINSKVEIGFIAQFPYLDSWSDSYTFFRSSDVQTFPSAANFKSTYNFAMYYPTAKTYLDIVAPLNYNVYNKNIKVTLTVDKATGKAMFAATNIVDGGAQATVTYPDGAYNRSTSFDYVDIACFPNAHMAQYSPNSSLNLLVGSMYVRYNDGEKNMLVGDWADTYVPLYRVYADKQIVNGNAIMLDVATPSKYGAVKPDGKTIRINAETGQLEADAGGVDLSDVVKLLTQTNAADQTVFSNVDANSIVGRVLAAQTDVTELDADVKALVSTISNLNTRLEAVLNGGQQ